MSTETNNIAKVQAERAALLDQLEAKQFAHEEAELKRLLEEVSRLHGEERYGDSEEQIVGGVQTGARAQSVRLSAEH